MVPENGLIGVHIVGCIIGNALNISPGRSRCLMLDVDVFAVDVCCYGYDLFEALLRQPSLTEEESARVSLSRVA